MPNSKHIEGELYRNIEVFGELFEIRYGYYEDFERDSGEPIPIYPDFKGEPRYTARGEPFVTAMQDMCESAEFKATGLLDECCENCRHYRKGDDLIGVCTNIIMKRNPTSRCEADKSEGKYESN